MAAESHGVALAKVVRVGEVEVDADSDRLRQVLVNLIANAVEATPAGGSISVMARTLKGGLARVSVRDRGPGVPEIFRPRLFRRFSQADSSDTREKGGIGLGLYIARSIIEAHGGTIGFRNHADGAEFHFDLPVLAGRNQRAKIPARRRI